MIRRITRGKWKFKAEQKYTFENGAKIDNIILLIENHSDNVYSKIMIFGFKPTDPNYIL